MAVVAPTPISALPTPPVLSDLATFSTRTDAFINALPTFRNENNTVASNVYSNAVDAQNNANTATAKAAEAAASATAASSASAATLWASGTYATGVCVYSPSSWATYRRTSVSPGASAVDPASAPTLWSKISAGELPTIAINTNTTAVVFNEYIIYGNCTLTLPAITGSNHPIGITVLNGVTGAIVAPAGTDKIRNVTGNMNVDNAPSRVVIKDTGATYGWV